MAALSAVCLSQRGWDGTGRARLGGASGGFPLLGALLDLLGVLVGGVLGRVLEALEVERAKVLGGLDDALLEGHLGLPAEELLGLGDVRPPPPGVVRGVFLEHGGRRRVHHLLHLLGELHHGELARVSDVDGAGVLAVHQRDQAGDQVGDVLERAPLVILVLTILYYTAYWLSTVYFVTTSKIYKRTGLVFAKVTSAKHTEIDDMKVQQGFLEKVLFNTGTIKFNTPGSAGFEIILPRVGEPFNMKKTLYEAWNK